MSRGHSSEVRGQPSVVRRLTGGWHRDCHFEGSHGPSKVLKANVYHATIVEVREEVQLREVCDLRLDSVDRHVIHDLLADVVAASQ